MTLTDDERAEIKSAYETWLHGEPYRQSEHVVFGAGFLAGKRAAGAVQEGATTKGGDANVLHLQCGRNERSLSDSRFGDAVTGHAHASAERGHDPRCHAPRGCCECTCADYQSTKDAGGAQADGQVRGQNGNSSEWPADTPTKPACEAVGPNPPASAVGLSKDEQAMMKRALFRSAEVVYPTPPGQECK